MANCILAAVGTAVVADIPVERALAALAALSPTPGRLQPLPLPGGAFVLRDDYKSTVDTVIAALDVLGRLPARRRIVVLGDLDMPPAPERVWYRSIGEQVAGVADEVLFVGTKHEKYRSGLRRSGRAPARVHAVRTTAEAAIHLASRLRAGDVVLVKGRETQRLTRVILALSAARWNRVACT
jgi:UDP-N-acetylmuramoyl-tripeptide--D-alanyl-D-alanine ligase